MFTPYHVTHVRCKVSGVRCQVSGVRCQVSHVTFQLSRVMCHVSCVTYFLFHLYKVNGLVGRGSIINGAYPVYFSFGFILRWNFVCTKTIVGEYNKIPFFALRSEYSTPFSLRKIALVVISHQMLFTYFYWLRQFTGKLIVKQAIAPTNSYIS